MTSGRLCNYYRDEVKDDASKNSAVNFRIDNSNTVTSKSFQCETKKLGSKPVDNITLQTKVFICSIKVFE